MELYDEDKAVDFIKQELANNEAVKVKYDSDDILEVIDIIWDYYEDNGMLDLDIADDDTEDENIDEANLIDHVIKMIKKDKGSKIDAADIPFIVKAELKYEQQCDEL